MRIAVSIPLPSGEGGAKRRVRGTALRPGSKDPKLFIKRAREMRRDDTRAERRVWNQLKDRRTLGLKFRRQAPIDRYIVDFYCHEIRVIVEIDGEVHDKPGQAEWDAETHERLEELGYKVLHISNNDVFTQPHCLLEMIRALYPSPGASRHPLPSGEGSFIK